MPTPQTEQTISTMEILADRYTELLLDDIAVSPDIEDVRVAMNQRLLDFSAELTKLFLKRLSTTESN